MAAALARLIAVECSHDGLYWSKDLGRWCLPFMGSDASVVKRTQRTLYSTTSGFAPAQFSAYFTIGALVVPADEFASAVLTVSRIGERCGFVHGLWTCVPILGSIQVWAGVAFASTCFRPLC
jgi:hypothetical protein